MSAENELILQHYRVTMAKHELSAVEMRIMAMVILKLKDAQIEGYGKDVKDISDLFDKFNRVTIRNADIVVSDNYGEVRKALKSLTKRDIELKKDGGTYFFNLVREAYYSDDKTKIDIDVSPHILPDLIEIGKNYTKFGLEFLFKTKSTHAIRWYQIGSHWLKDGVFYIPKEDIREIFKAQNKYTKHVNFQRRLITDPINEVNEKSDIKMKVAKTHKEGRTIVGYTITVKRKGKAVEEKPTEEIPIFLKNYVSKYWDVIAHLAQKSNYDYDIINEKLKQRGVPDGITSQQHFDNATHKLIATILVKDGKTNLDIEQMIKELRS